MDGWIGGWVDVHINVQCLRADKTAYQTIRRPIYLSMWLVISISIYAFFPLPVSLSIYFPVYYLSA